MKRRTASRRQIAFVAALALLASLRPAAAAADPLPHVTVVSQYMEGVTRTEVNAFDSAFRAVYALVSLGWRRHRLSARYDFFRVDDRDGAPVTREHGHALTFAWLFEIGLRHRVGIEYLRVTSRRPATGFDDPSDGGWQFSWRYSVLNAPKARGANGYARTPGTVPILRRYRPPAIRATTSSEVFNDSLERGGSRHRARPSVHAFAGPARHADLRRA